MFRAGYLMSNGLDRGLLEMLVDASLIATCGHVIDGAVEQKARWFQRALATSCFHAQLIQQFLVSYGFLALDLCTQN
jgi:hypothetical protein